ncbi:MAG: hypothetical protein ABFD97_00145 [Syntrophobacter sp.]
MQISVLARGLLLLAVLLAGCQTTPFQRTAGFIAPDDQVAFSADQGAGTWKGRDLEVQFNYSPKQRDNFSGVVQLGSNIVYNFSSLRDFQLSVFFVDTSGKILGNQAVVTNRGNFDPIPFRTQLIVPPNTTAIAFSYQGTALSSGNDDGGGLTSFWHYPVHR